MILRFFPDGGSDERQYCSPGFDLPVGSLTRTLYDYAEYHTSGDNKSFLSFDAMVDTIQAYAAIVHALESNFYYQGTVLYGEPQMGRHQLYHTLGAQREMADWIKVCLWILNLADGSCDLLSIAERSGKSLSLTIKMAETLHEAGLLHVNQNGDPPKLCALDKGANFTIKDPLKRN